MIPQRDFSHKTGPKLQKNNEREEKKSLKKYVQPSLAYKKEQL